MIVLRDLTDAPPGEAWTIDEDHWRETGRSSRFAYDERRHPDWRARRPAPRQIRLVDARRARRRATHWSHMLGVLPDAAGGASAGISSSRSAIGPWPRAWISSSGRSIPSSRPTRTSTSRRSAARRRRISSTRMARWSGHSTSARRPIDWSSSGGFVVRTSSAGLCARRTRRLSAEAPRLPALRRRSSAPPPGRQRLVWIWTLAACSSRFRRASRRCSNLTPAARWPGASPCAGVPRLLRARISCRGFLDQRRRRRVPPGAYPGGQLSFRPASTCRWM